MSLRRIYPSKFQNLKNRINFFKEESLKEESLFSRFICSLCDDILVEPQQLICGCRFCYSCLSIHIRDVQAYCPGCKDVVKSIKDNIMYDKAVEKEIFELKLLCINKNCKHVCKLKNMCDHLSECEKRDKLGDHVTFITEQINNMKMENVEIKSKCSKSNEKLAEEVYLLGDAVQTSSNTITELRNKLMICERNYSRLQSEVIILKQSLKLSPSSKTDLNGSISLSNTTSNGEYTWIVDRITDRIADAKSGINVQILSDSFYTNKPGYQMCLKMYPNGDGTGFGRFISLYFVIMKGDYDDFITWPFNLKVLLRVKRNGSTINNDFVVYLKPDSNVTCYGRPSTEHNLAAGIPQFISHKLLDTFTTNDTITIRASVG